MGEDEDGLLPHQRRHAHRIAGVLHEDQEGGAVVDEAAVQGDAIHDRPHGEFAHPVIDVVAAGVGGANAFRATPEREIGARQVCGTT